MNTITLLKLADSLMPMHEQRRHQHDENDGREIDHPGLTATAPAAHGAVRRGDRFAPPDRCSRKLRTSVCVPTTLSGACVHAAGRCQPSSFRNATK